MGKVIFIYFLLLPVTLANARHESRAHIIYVASLGWHTGIVVPGYSMPDSLWPEGHHYGEDSYLEIGWGDGDFYPHEGFNLWYALKAALWPTASVLHVNPIGQDAESYYIATDVVKIALNEQQLQQLVHYLIEEFEKDKEGVFIPAQVGRYLNSYFYEGSSSYYFPNNSNVWAARALKRAGFSISPIWYQTTGWVLNMAENFGTQVAED